MDLFYYVLGRFSVVFSFHRFRALLMDALVTFVGWLLVGGWIYLEIKMLWLSRSWKTSDDFGLTPKEQVSLTNAKNKALRANQKLGITQKKLVALDQKGKGLRRNKNGDFDRRSALGKKLNSERKRNQALSFRYKNEGNQAESKIDKLIQMPSRRARPWINSEAKRIALRLIIIGFALSIPIVSELGSDLFFAWPLMFGILLVLYFAIVKLYDKEISKSLGY